MVRAALLLLAACAPAFGDAPWRIDSPRVIAVIAEPPEAEPGAAIMLSAIVAGGAADVGWSRCDTPRPPVQNAPVAEACVESARTAPSGPPQLTALLNARACALFGPQTASAQDRPRDADPTGGWYEPFGTTLDSQLVFTFVRLHCAPAGVSLDVARAYAAAWRPNANPSLRIEAAQQGRTVELRAEHDAEEEYALIDPATLELTHRRELYEVSWFTTAGELANQTLMLPATGEATVWAVLRDGRGGTAVATRQLR